MNVLIEKNIGNNIRKLREDLGITQEELSSRLQTLGCDITRSALAKIEIGQRHLYPDEIIFIKMALNVSYDDIFDISK
jgi:transcriptional regulator with XRE-family HTH domain